MSEEIQRSALERLPQELKIAIFTELPDVQSLRSAILTGRELYCSIKADETRLVRQILSRQIQREVLEDAVAVLEAKRAKRAGWSHEQIDLLFLNFRNTTDDFLQACNLHRALELARFHQLVQDFSKHLAEQAMHSASMRYPEGDGDSVWVADQEELVRIERALYRFELYCTFFGNTKERLIQPGAGQRAAFWDRFAPWEIEQIACVYEHVYQEVSPAFEQLALTVPDWTEFASITGCLTDACDQFFQAQVILGLEHIRKIQTSGCAPTTRDHKLQPPYKGQVFDHESIGESLNQAIWGDPYLTLHEMEQHPEAASEAVRPPFSADADCGPETVWRWAHRDMTPDVNEGCGFVLGDTQLPLRECGYVFWSRERLEAWSLFDVPWMGSDSVELSNERKQKVAEFTQKLFDRKEEMIKSGILRRGLWL